MPQGTVSELEEFRVPGTEDLEARLMKYLEGEKYAWLQEHWIPKLLAIAGKKKPAVGIVWHICGTLAQLNREGSSMPEKPLTPDTLDKMYATQDLKLFGVFFESKEVAEKAWKQLPPWMPDKLMTSADLASAVLAPMKAKVIFTSRYSITAARPEKELKHKESSTFYGSSSCGRPRSRPSTAPLDQLSSFPSLNSTSFGIVNPSEDEGPNTVEGSSSCGPPASGPSTAPYGQLSPLPSINNTSFGIARHSDDEESSTSSRPNPGGPTAVYHWQEPGPPGFGRFPFSSGSLPLVYTNPSACGPTPFAAVPSSTSPGVSSYADTEKAKDERSSASNRSERPWAKFSVRMDGEPLVDDDGVVFETPGFRNRGAA
ncbi:hypothetical protein H634G_10650 [Metarhizium anisopliae BRIP 53293]|uniref:Uncharacterized protein n=1 Tax=Metarhizium anisopliae BRIP 53293 TaxID=1291518 RepID=A0A0D9NJR8_METAN|nr:hypothetical protein H634G_10650 [Metarhizium anisopliae BRIP 53293]KJK87042.1 hypothetical protein H633G_09113 [Metarhizium anisopliae BRIP 53284]